jgi:succinate dehydrogenase/fumarate reductase flavoprotein subunit
MEGITRRQFVGTAGAAAALTAVAVSERSALAEEPEEYDYEADVVAIGSGAAGLMACAGAHEQGASSLLLEKRGSYGGDSLVCHQDILAFWPERTLSDAGFEDTRESYLADWRASHDVSSVKGLAGEPMPDETPHCERFVDIFSRCGNWLVNTAGVQLTPVILGSSLATVYSVEPRTWHADTPVVENVLNTLQTYDDFQLMLSSEALSLIQNESGRVVGVRFMQDGQIKTAKANGGVVIATGTFNGNQWMVANYIGYQYSLATSYSNTGSTGDGHRMASEIGARLDDMGLGMNYNVCWMGDDNYWNVNNHLGKFGSAEGSVALHDPAIYVNREGNRYANELLGYNGMGRSTCNQTARMGYYVFDSAFVDEELIGCGGIVIQADTLESLADKIDIPSDAFVQTVERYNGFVDSGVDEDFGRDMEGSTKIETAPFYAMIIVPRPYVTLGGIATDVDSRVLDVNGNPIEGLYAAGICCGSYAEQEGMLYYGGFAQSLSFGMQAGENAAQEALA